MTSTNLETSVNSSTQEVEAGASHKFLRQSTKSHPVYPWRTITFLLWNIPYSNCLTSNLIMKKLQVNPNLRTFSKIIGLYAQQFQDHGRQRKADVLSQIKRDVATEYEVASQTEFWVRKRTRKEIIGTISEFRI